SEYLSVYFENTSLLPDNETLFLDEFIETCARFNLGDDAKVPLRTAFRIPVAADVVQMVNVSLIGVNMAFGRHLYITALSAAETEKWTGRWTTCRLRETSMYENKEKCLYECQISGSGAQIQVMKIPSSVDDSSWSLCNILLIYGGMEK
ncbi:hypothetical protein LSH36_458g01020, partial [Paralvinella palmiformis]